MTRRFLLVGIDGVRLDRLQETETPHIDEIAARGFLRTAKIPPQNPTMSGAQWATILTGVWAPDHGVVDNEVPSAALAGYPDVLQQVVARHPGSSVFAGVSWPPLAIATGCGPVLRTPTYLPYPKVTLPGRWRKADALVTADAVARLSEPETVAGFVYLGLVDIMGHAFGTGRRYVNALKGADAQLGELVAAIDARGDREDWTIMVTTDHGHRDKGGHGTRTEAEETVWFACDRPLPGWEQLDSAGVPGYLLASLLG